MIISAKGMHKHPSHKNSSGFTLIEMLIAIAIISILAAVGIPQYNAYKIRGYDAHTRQALSDIYKLCNAYWIDTNPSEACDISTIKTPIYGFTQNPDVTSTLSSLSRDKFCASAKHKDSTSTYSIDSAAVISPGNACVVESPVEEASLSTPIDDDPPETTPEENRVAEILAEELVEQTASVSPAQQAFNSYDPSEECEGNADSEGMGTFAVVGLDGSMANVDLEMYGYEQTKQYITLPCNTIGELTRSWAQGDKVYLPKSNPSYSQDGQGFIPTFSPGGEWAANPVHKMLQSGSHKLVFVGGENRRMHNLIMATDRDRLKYHWESKVFMTPQGQLYKNGLSYP